MIDDKVYAVKLEQKLIEQFKELFHEKIGYYPIVLTKVLAGSSKHLAIMSLEDLEEHFDPFLPEKWGHVPSLKSKYRWRELVELRQMFCNLARMMGYTFTAIGDYLGKRDHTTVIHNLNTFANLIETHESFKAKYLVILHHIKKSQPHESPLMDQLNQAFDQPQPVVLP